MCEDCSTSGGNDASLFRLEDCPKNANVSCFRSIVNFGTHTGKFGLLEDVILLSIEAKCGT